MEEFFIKNFTKRYNVKMEEFLFKNLQREYNQKKCKNGRVFIKNFTKRI
jgi:hypothetical protein